MKLKIVGITDAVNSCDCCGKTNLKKTAILKTETDEILYYGANCAATALSYTDKKYTASNIEKLKERNERAEKAVAQREETYKRAQEYADQYRVKTMVYRISGDKYNPGRYSFTPYATGKDRHWPDQIFTPKTA